MKKFIAVICFVALMTGVLAGCQTDGSSGGSDGTIVFADVGWDSVKFHNAVAGYIAETAFDYSGWSEITAGSTVSHEGLLSGEIDVLMEVWVDNLDFYPGDLAAGKLQEFGVNFDDNKQGLYVPRYVIEGDPERGIEPLAPDLKTVKDLARYADIFPDDEVPGKGRIYGAIPGWLIDEIMYNKFNHYGLGEQYEYFRPGSDAAMNASFTAAYEKGEPIVGYYWEPTWLLGMYDFVLLEDEPYTNEEDFNSGKTECPSVTITIATSNKFADTNPDFCAFLERYHTSSGMISEALAYMQDTSANHTQAAQWFLREHDELLDEWLEPEQAQRVRDALK